MNARAGTFELRAFYLMAVNYQDKLRLPQFILPGRTILWHQQVHH